MINLKVMLRIYRQHDMDLVGLHLHSSFMLGRAIKQALMAYVRGEVFKIDTPVEEELPNEIRRVYQIQIFLDDIKDKDIIDWLKTTNPGQRNSLIKNIFRSYAFSLYVKGYGNIKEESYVEEEEKVRGRMTEVVELRKIERKSKKKK